MCSLLAQSLEAGNAHVSRELVFRPSHDEQCRIPAAFTN